MSRMHSMTLWFIHLETPLLCRPSTRAGKSETHVWPSSVASLNPRKRSCFSVESIKRQIQMSDSILTLLVNTILERFRAAGFQVPENMTQKESEEFVFLAIENAAIVPADRYESLIATARSVIENWEGNGLAEAVRKLDAILGDIAPATQAD